MLTQERQNKIISILVENSSIKILDIVNQFNVSHETARRDLDALQKQGIVKRVYGGGILISDAVPPVMPSVYRRKASRPDEKQVIGKTVADLIHNGDTVLLGVGSTILEVAKNIHDKKDLTVLTNSISVLNELIDSNINLYFLGGRVSNGEHHTTGFMMIEGLCHFNVDVVVIGAGGISLDVGITDYDDNVAQIVKAMMSRGQKTILVAQSDKFDKICFNITCPLTTVDTLVSDSNLSQKYISALQEMGIEVLLAELNSKTSTK